MNDIITIVQTLADSNILFKGALKQLKMKQKNKKEILLGTLGAGLLGNMLAGKEIVRASSGRSSLNSFTSYEYKNGKGIVRAGTGKNFDF